MTRHTAALLVALLVAGPVAAQPVQTPMGMMDAAPAQAIESALDAFFAVADAAGRAAIHEQHLRDKPVGLTLAELDAIAAAGMPGDSPTRTISPADIYHVKTPWLSDHPRGVFALAIPRDYTPTKSYGLAVVLHGRNGAADSLAPGYAAKLTAAGYLVLFPQTAEPHHYWSTTSELANVYRLMEWVARRYRIDFSRLAVSGASMGAMGAWSHVLAEPQLWHAAAPVAGHPGLLEPRRIARAKGVPLYVLAGANDTQGPGGGPIVPIRESVELLKRLGIEHVYDEVPGAGHTPPLEAFARLNDWLVRQPARPWSARPLFLPTAATPPAGPRNVAAVDDDAKPPLSLWQGALDPLRLNVQDDAVLNLVRQGELRQASDQVRKLKLRSQGDARLAVLQAVAALPPLLEPTPQHLNAAALADAPGGWNERAEDQALSALRSAANLKLGKGPAPERFDAEVNHLIARIWAKRVAVSIGDASGQAWVFRYNNFARHASQTQIVQPGHLETNRLIAAVNELVPTRTLGQ